MPRVRRLGFLEPRLGLRAPDPLPIEARHDRLCRNDRVVRVVLHLVVSLGRPNATVLHLLAKVASLEIGRDAEAHRRKANAAGNSSGLGGRGWWAEALKAFPAVFFDGFL